MRACECARVYVRVCARARVVGKGGGEDGKKKDETEVSENGPAR